MSSKRDDDEEANITSAYQAMMAAQIYAQNSSISAQTESRQTNYHVAASQQQYPISQHRPRDASHLQAIHTPPVVYAYNNNATNNNNNNNNISNEGNNNQLMHHNIQQQMQQQMQQLAEMRSRERLEQQLIPQPQQIGGQVFDSNYNNSINSQLDQMRERVMRLSQHHAQLKATSERMQQELNYKMLLESQQRGLNTNHQQQTQLMRRAQQHNMKRNIPPFDNTIPISSSFNSSIKQQQYQHGHSIQSQHKMEHTKQPQQHQQQLMV